MDAHVHHRDGCDGGGFASVHCRRHPRESVTGFCAACLRERLSVLDSSAAAAAATTGRKSTSSIKSLFGKVPALGTAGTASSATELRRCKSFSCGRPDGLAALRISAATAAAAFEPRIHSGDSVCKMDRSNFGFCDIEEAAGAELRRMRDHIDLESNHRYHPTEKARKEDSRSFWSMTSAFSKRWCEWRRKQKLKAHPGAGTSKAARAAMPPPPKKAKGPSFQRRRKFRDSQSEAASCTFGRLSFDVDPRFSVDLVRNSVDEPRASWDGHLVGGGGSSWRSLGVSRFSPMLSMVEDAPAPAPAFRNFSAYLPVDEDASVPGGSVQTRDYYLDSSSRRRRSFERSSSVRGSSVDLSDARSVMVNSNAKVSPAGMMEFYQPRRSTSVLDHDSVSGNFEPAFRDANNELPPVMMKKSSRKWKGWNFWGLMQKKGSRKREEPVDGNERSLSESWPESGATRGFLRSNSSASIRSAVNGRRHSVELNEQHEKRRKDWSVGERNQSARYSPNHVDNAMLRFYLTPSRAGQRNGPSVSSGRFSSRGPQQSKSRSTLRFR